MSFSNTDFKINHQDNTGSLSITPLKYILLQLQKIYIQEEVVAPTKFTQHIQQNTVPAIRIIILSLKLSSV